MISSLLPCAWTWHSTNSRRASFTSSRFRSTTTVSILFRKISWPSSVLLMVLMLTCGLFGSCNLPKFTVNLSECALNMLFHYGDTSCSHFFIYLCVTSATSTTTYHTMPLVSPYNGPCCSTCHSKHSCHLQIVLPSVVGVTDPLFGLQRDSIVWHVVVVVDVQTSNIKVFISMIQTSRTETESFIIKLIVTLMNSEMPFWADKKCKFNITFDIQNSIHVDMF